MTKMPNHLLHISQYRVYLIFVLYIYIYIYIFIYCHILSRNSDKYDVYTV